ncbi:MAG: SGNH/GDSL hydrolase family protein, partial [Opitutae bacterium]|nr:SGNH/GDSL hydrolase family protein [Opitutae bacterium]
MHCIFTLIFFAISLPVTVASPLTDIVQALEVDWPKNKTIHFVCHGHSVPAGYFKTPVVNSDQSYPALWQTGLRQQFP